MFSQEDLPIVISAYNRALTHCFYASLAMALLGVVASFGMEWVSVKGKKIEVGVGA